MRRYFGIMLIVFLFFVLAGQSVAENSPLPYPMIVVPTKTIATIIEDILPLEIDLGKNFPKNVYIQSVDDLKIGNNKVLFTIYIYGENVEHTFKIGDQAVVLKVGKVNLNYDCETTFRFDREKRTLFLTPRVKDITSQDKMGKGNQILSPLLTALSDIEYPLTIDKFDPIVTRLGQKILNFDFGITRIFSNNDRLFIEVAPKVTTKIKPVKTKKAASKP